MDRFRDTTGRHGPADWVAGEHADGEGDLPVTGVSWFEAAAYAEFAGKRLPTIFHWNQLACTLASPEIVPLSNLGGEEARPRCSGTGLQPRRRAYRNGQL